jgi:hypothetical protein
MEQLCKERVVISTGLGFAAMARSNDVAANIGLQ